jgi:hypothetical protein
VFNSLGQEVARLIESEQAAGTYNVNVDLSGFGSGFYFYRLKTIYASTGSAPGFVETKKMILLK